MAPSSDNENYCALCDLSFPTASALEAHLQKFSSEINQDSNLNSNSDSDSSCSLCEEAFATTSGVLTHIESGGCPCAPTLDRETLYKIIQAADSRSRITDSDLFMLDLERQERALALFEVAQQESDGTGWQCCLCERDFNSWIAVCQHLNSPVHKRKIYYCPLCEKNFSSLGGLFSHLESEACDQIDPDRLWKVGQAIMGLVMGSQDLEKL